MLITAKLSRYFSDSWQRFPFCLSIVAWLGLASSGLGAPSLVSTASLDGQTVALIFAEDLDPTVVATAAIYTVTGATVQGAQLLDDQRTILLSVTSLSGSTYTVSAVGLKDAQGATANINGTGTILGWTAQDIGDLPEPTIAYARTSDAIEVLAKGGTVWFNADSGNLISRPRTGDFDVRVQVSKVSGGGPNSNMILDARETADAGSRHVAITVYPSQKNWTSFRRADTDGASSVLAGNWRVAWPAGIDFPNAWLRLKRSGNSFTTYGSTNGLDWIQIGDAYSPDPPYTDNLVLGLATGVTDAGVPPLEVEYSNFGNFALTNAVIVINAQPQSVSVIENHPATFSVAATLQNGPVGVLSYQWQRDGVDIPGALGSSYTLALASLGDQGAQFRVKISAPGVASVTSAAATLNVQKDTAAPYIVSTAGLVGYTIGIVFDKPLDPASAADATLYTVNGGTAIDSATLLADQQTVVLQVSALTGSTYTLKVNGVKDLAGNTANTTAKGPVLDLAVQDLDNLPAPSLVYARTASDLDVQVSGGAIWFNADSGNLISQSKTGDFDVRVQVSKVAGGSPNSNFILDARETADPGSRHVAITVYPTQKNWTAFRRVDTDGASSVLAGNWRVAWPADIDFPNAWLRLKRAGNSLSTYGSTNGLDWIQIGDAYAPDPAYPDKLVVGLATGVTDAGVPPVQVEYSNFGDFALTNALIVINAQPQSVTVQENHPATFSAEATLQNGPVGALSYQWQRNGVDIAGAVGSTYTLALPSLGDQAAKFRVRVSAPGVTPVDSAAATLDVQPDTTPPQALSAYAFVGTMVTVCFDELLDSTSADDATRYKLGAGQEVQSAALQTDGQTVLLGVSGLSGTQFTLTVTGVGDLKGNLATNTITGNFAGLTVLDVGDVAAPGLVLGCSADPIQILARGADIWGLVDSFNFVFQQIRGDFDLRVQMDSITLVNGATRGGLMVREDTSPGSRNVFAGTYPKAGDGHWVATARNTADGTTIILPGGYIPRDTGFDFPNAWLRLKRVGQAFTAYYGTNGVDWVQLGDAVTADPAYPETIMVGLASASIDAGGNAGDQYAAFEYRNYGPTPAAPPAVRLAISAATPNVIITWPATAAGFQLQQSTQIGTGAAWTAITNAPVQTGDQNQVTVPIATGTRFYRLAR